MPAADRPTPIETFVHRAGSLYSLPAVAVEVLQLTSSAKADAAALTDCIERDPALVGKILRTVNSSLFGTPRKVSDLNQAVTLLGIKPLKLLVLGFSLPPKLLSGIERQSLEQYWRRTLIKAVAARELAAAARRVDADDAFLAGLLQDIGMLVLLKDLGEPYAQFLAKARVEQGDVLMLELETLGFDHRLLGARLLQHWGLPEVLWRATASAPSTDGAPEALNNPQTLSELLTAADAMASLLAQGQPDALAALLAGDEPTEVERWAKFAGRLQEKVDQFADVLEIALPAGEDFEQVVITAHARLAEEAEDAAARLVNSPAPSTWSESRNLEAAARALDERMLSAAHGPSRNRSEQQVAAMPTTLALSDPGLLGRVERGVANCRLRRQPLSLLLIEVDNFEEITFAAGLSAAMDYVQQLQRSIQIVLETTGAAFMCGDAQIALLLAGTDRAAGVDLARQLLAGVRSGQLAAGGAIRSTLSIGLASVALPAKNFPADALIEAAQRCLFGVQAGGGDGVKSLDIY